MTAETKQAVGVSEPLTREQLDEWATDPSGPVALYLKQELISVEGKDAVIFPPTYADIGYNIDTLSDGKKVVTIDSIGSQANRLEAIFKKPTGGQPENPLAKLVPQIEIRLNETASVSIFDVAHRAADATVQSCPGLAELVEDALKALQQRGDAGPLCSLVPTSLVFGIWDSRGSTGEKRPRLVRSVIRAWDVEVLHAAAQFNSVWKLLDQNQQTELKERAKKEKVDLSEKGLADAPVVFRKTKIPQWLNGAPNPEARVLGGVLVKDRIEREVTVNLVALRGLRGEDDEETKHVRAYLLGLSLLAATADIDLFLREGCHLRYAGDDKWFAVPRRGDPVPVKLDSAEVRNVIQSYASEAAEHFKRKWPETLEYTFDLEKAKGLRANKNEQEPGGD